MNKKGDNYYALPYKQILIEAVRGSNWNSDIAIDELELEGGSCTNSKLKHLSYPFTPMIRWVWYIPQKTKESILSI